MPRFPPLIGPHTQDPRANDPHDLDLDAACVTMLTLDLPALFGIMARPACRRIPVRDLEEFEDWLHVISDPIVVKVFAGTTDAARNGFKASLVDILRTEAGITLTCATSSCTLSTSQVNIPVAAMSEALFTLGARLCRVSFFGMKWSIPSAEPVIDNFIRRYRMQMGAELPIGRNQFDYGARFPTNAVLLFKFSDQQEQADRYREGSVHEMCNERDFGSIECRPLHDDRLKKIKVYQQLIHDILSCIPRRTLDDVPQTIFTIRTRAIHMQTLLQRWMEMPHDMRVRRLGGVRVELTVRTEYVVDGRRLCSEHDLFSVAGVEAALGGTFETRELSFDRLIESSQELLTGFTTMLYGRNERRPSVEILSALTFARQAFGWSGRFMNRQLRRARDWEVVARAAEQRIENDDDEEEFAYRGAELDEAAVRPLIQDFLDHAEWTLPGRVRDRTVPGLMLRSIVNGKFLPQRGVYSDRVSGARHFIGLHGVRWREYIRFLI